MEIKEEYLNKQIKLNDKSYTLREIFEKINLPGINPYFDVPEFVDISLLKELDSLKIYPEKNENLWILTDKIIKKNFLGGNQSHNCYWNDSFYLTNKFNSKEFDKKKSAIVALWNGRNNYWEWETHYGFNNKKLLLDLNLKEKDPNAPRYSEYTSIPRDLHDSIRDYFGLTNDDLRSARWICDRIYGKEQEHKTKGRTLETKFSLDF